MSVKGKETCDERNNGFNWEAIKTHYSREIIENTKKKKQKLIKKKKK